MVHTPKMGAMSAGALTADIPEPERFAVRIAAVDDAAGIAAAHVEGWRAAYRGLLPQSLLDRLSVERRTEEWHRAIQDGAADVHVAADPGGDVGGFVATGRSRDGDADDTIGELFSIYLRPQLWHRGLGSRLHAAATEALAVRFAQATLWVLDGNTRARTFYERERWQPDGAIKHDTVGDVRVVEMRYRRALDGTAR